MYQSVAGNTYNEVYHQSKILSMRNFTSSLSLCCCSEVYLLLQVKARNRTYKVKGVGPCPEEAMFQLKDRETEKFREISVMNYFRDCLDIQLLERDLPVLQCGSAKKPTYVPIELAE